jgi:hypothetical protein
MWRRDAGNYALLLDSNIRNSVCTPAKLPCRGGFSNNKFEKLN